MTAIEERDGVTLLRRAHVAACGRSSSCARRASGREVPRVDGAQPQPGVTSPTSAGAKTSAGRKLPTLTSLRSSSFSAIPMISTPPALVSAASASLPSARIVVEEARGRARSPPWIDEHADRREARRPGPSDAASAIEAKPSSRAFVASAW